MRILYLTQKLPFPAESGGSIKTLHTLRLLAEKHQVFLVCFVLREKDLSFKKEIEKYCRGIRVIVSNFPFDHFKNIRPLIFKSLFSPYPFIVYRYQDERFKEAVEEILGKEKIDAIHIDHLNMTSYLPEKKDCLWVLEEHNLESEINWGIARREKWNKFKLFSFLEALKLTIYERRVVSKFDYIFAISEDDRGKLIRLGAKEEKVFFLPTPFVVKPLFRFKNQPPLILFVGMLSWWPNKDGFFWFYKKVFPLVKEKIPNVKFVVIGKEATREMISLDKKHPDFKLVGYAKNIDKYLSQASVFIVPLRAGSGIRIKILTALSAGIPVVSTKKGAEGIVNKSSDGIVLADKPGDFAKAVIEILKNKNQANRLSKSGLDLVKRNFNQQKAAEVLERVYP